jgi:hypothetical protein
MMPSPAGLDADRDHVGDGCKRLLAMAQCRGYASRAATIRSPSRIDSVIERG